jgi:hypothetical protein
MDDQARGGPRANEDGAGLSPVRAFLVVGALLAAVVAAYVVTRDPAPARATAPAGPTRSPDYSLTDAEAIAEFERLNAQLMQAYEERNIALAEEVFTSDSPMLPRVRKEIQDLLEADVLSKTQFREIKTVISKTSPSFISIQRTEVLVPRFKTEEGVDATGTSLSERRVVRWELHQQAGRWLLHDGTVVDRERLRQGHG